MAPARLISVSHSVELIQRSLDGVAILNCNDGPIEGLHACGDRERSSP